MNKNTDESLDVDESVTPPVTPPVTETEPIENPTETLTGDQDGTEDDPETFPLAYVAKLRTEAADARVKAKRAGELEALLFTERVKATGRMADPSDLAVDVALLDDPEALTAAIDALLATKPHLASRRPYGNVGQGISGAGADVDLAAMLRIGA